ncbi:hypothetical protein DFH06DRAFT_1240902 [Mycena polygramma]|nr:hypothetical protein DFH06DRAFT_1240902 [Mycena polygramma]
MTPCSNGPAPARLASPSSTRTASLRPAHAAKTFVFVLVWGLVPFVCAENTEPSFVGAQNTPNAAPNPSRAPAANTAPGCLSAPHAHTTAASKSARAGLQARSDCDELLALVIEEEGGEKELYAEELLGKNALPLDAAADAATNARHACTTPCAAPTAPYTACEGGAADADEFELELGFHVNHGTHTPNTARLHNSATSASLLARSFSLSGCWCC